MSSRLIDQSPSKGEKGAAQHIQESASQKEHAMMSEDAKKQDALNQAVADDKIASDGGAEQALQEENDKQDQGSANAGSLGRAAAEPLSWGTRLAQKLYIQVACVCPGGGLILLIPLSVAGFHEECLY